MANNKVALSDGTVLIDLTGDTAVASDVASGKTFHLASGLQATGTATGGAVQSDWEETDTESMAYVLNKPSIAAGDGDNSVMIGQIEQADDAAMYTIYLTGDADATTFTFTTEDTIPSDLSLAYCFLFCSVATITSRWIRRITSLDVVNNTLTLTDKLHTQALIAEEAIIYYKSKINFAKHGTAEGEGTAAIGTDSHVEGQYSLASYVAAHAEGYRATASGAYSHAEGGQTVASATASHAEGQVTTASGSYSHAEGYHTKASKSHTHAEGYYTNADGNYQHVQGRYNIVDSSSVYADIVGNGTSDSARSNAYTLDWSGNGWYAGKVTVGSGPVNDMDLATKQYVDSVAGGASYSISMSNNIITLTGSDGSTSNVTLPVYNGGVS